MRYINLVIVASLALVSFSSEMNGSTDMTNVSGSTVYEKNRGLYKTECDAGDGEGCSHLGTLYEKGLGVSKNLYRAFELNKKGCELGSGWSCTKVGEFYLYGEGVSKNLQSSTAYYKKGCELNTGVSCNNSGFAYANGHGVAKDDAIAEGYYKKAISLGNNSYSNLGFLYASQGDVAKAKVFYKKACDLKEKKGCFNLAYRYEQEKDFASAYTYYVRSCNYGDGEACNNGTMMIFNKKKGVSSDTKTIFNLSLKSCELENKIGCSNLAYFYKNGLGVAKNNYNAQKFYKKACKLGDSGSCKKVVANKVATIK